MKVTLLPVGIVSVFFLLGCITSISAFSDLRSPLQGRRDIVDEEYAQEINYEDYGGPVPQNLEYDYPTSYGAYGPPFTPPPPAVTPASSSSSTSSSASGGLSSGAGSGSSGGSSGAGASSGSATSLAVSSATGSASAGPISNSASGSRLRIRSSRTGVRYGLFIIGFGVDGLSDRVSSWHCVCGSRHRFAVRTRN
ncbi:hypothetical protein DL769_003997 [Monosporascus sp. CRB-8-3]|nr:hypothetical protein DL769_003997 [Monosporascus sp. CRB-8-3]